MDLTESRQENSTPSAAAADNGSSKIEDLADFYLQAEQILDTNNLKKDDSDRKTRLTRVTQYNLEERIKKVKK